MDKDKARAKLRAAFKIKYKQDIIQTVGIDAIETVDIIPTGVASLNAILGIGGYPRGRLVELYGPEQSGKSTLCYCAMAEAQKLGLHCTYIDAEHALDIKYARALGVQDGYTLIKPDSAEQALQAAYQLAKKGLTDLVVIDSVAALVPQAEQESEITDTTMALQARLMGKVCRFFVGMAAKTNATILFINQIRMNIGTWGNPETTAGGKALKFYSSVRLDVRRGKSIKKNDEVIGITTKVKVIKNKLAIPYKKTEFDLMLGKGVNKAKDLGLVSKLLGVVTLKGAWVYHNENQLCQGMDNLYIMLANDPILFNTLEQDVLALQRTNVIKEG